MADFPTLADKKHFLETHMDKIVQKTNNPSHLADALYGGGLIDRETLLMIYAKKTNQDKTRKIYASLNSSTHYDFMYDWFKKNESHLFEDLENDDTEAEAPQKKRVRREDDDETDNNLTGFPDLKTISSFAKLEEWVSKPGIGQKMISDLEGKLGVEGMAALRKELKVKEPRNSLCFNASNIDDIRKNKELEKFLNATKNAKIPKLTFDMWFKKSGSASSGNRAQRSTDHWEFMDMVDFSSSGFESSSSSSFNNSYSLVSFNYSSENDEGLPDEDLRHTENMDIMIHENKHNERESKTSEKLLGGPSIQMDHEVKVDAPLQEPVNMQDGHIDEMEEQSQRLNVPCVARHEDESLHQNESIAKKETPLEDGLGSMDFQDAYIDKMEDESRRSNVPRHEDESLHQNEQITENEPPLEDGLGGTFMQKACIDAMEEEPQRLKVPNIPKHEEESPHHNDQITKKETPLDVRHGSMDLQEMQIDEIDDEPKRSYVPYYPRHEKESLHQNEPIAKKETSLEDGLGSTDMKEQCNSEMDEQLKRSNAPRREDESLHQNETITKKEPPLEVGLGSMDFQDAHIDKMEDESQRLNIPHVPRYEDESLHQNEQITENEPPLEVGLGGTFMQKACIDAMEEEPQRLKVPNIPKHEEESLHHNDQITKKETPLEDKFGSTDMKEQCNNEMDEQLKISNAPRREESLHQNVQITKKQTPLEDGLGGTFMQKACIDAMEEEPQRSNVPMHAASLHQNESAIKSKIPLEGRCGNMNMQENPGPVSPKQLQKNSPGSASELKEINGTEGSVLNQDPVILAKPGDVKDRNRAPKKRANSNHQKEKKKNEKDKQLRDWALRQCKNREEDLRNVFDQISVINMAEHSDYPCFTAENVMVYKYLTPESQIIFITEDNTSINTRTMVQYQMFVCNIKKAILLGPKKPHEEEIVYNKSQVPVDKCRDFIFKAFAPALTVYKETQKEEKLYSLI